MSAFKWATALVVAGAVAAPAMAMADDDPAPSPTPAPTATPTPTPTPAPPIDGLGNGNTVYVITVTTTTTTVNAPITWVAAPIDTTVNNSSPSEHAATPRLELNITGCRRSKPLKRATHQRSQLRAPGEATLLVR